MKYIIDGHFDLLSDVAVRRKMVSTRSSKDCTILHSKKEMLPESLPHSL